MKTRNGSPTKIACRKKNQLPTQLPDPEKSLKNQFET